MNKKLVMLTAYDYPTAKIVDEVGVDYLLVGDSLGMVVLGYPNTTFVTMQDMLHHVQAVARGAKKSIIVADMPIHTYDNTEDALKNAKLFIKAGAHMVKIEGNKPEIVKALKKKNINVIGHLGLLPQTAETYRVQGKDRKAAQEIFQAAINLENAGVQAIILECIPQRLAEKITQQLKVPSIGIGAGKFCDGQVLVLHDVIGLSGFQGKFVKQYANVRETIKNAVSAFKEDVLKERFPAEKESFL